MIRTRKNGIGASTRKRPTASEKRQRIQQSDVELVVQDEDSIDELLEELLGPFPGGPVDASILKSFSTHVALNIWNGEERAPLKLVNHGQKLEKWVLNDNCLLIRAIVVQSGLASLLDCTYTVASGTIVSAFCERWQPETNTFHLPFGEMTITLDDVASILHIPVNGEMISLDSIDVHKANVMLVELLGVEFNDAVAETSFCRGPSVRLSWLRSHFENVTDTSDDRNIQFATRAFLLYLVGCTLFVDKSAANVSVSYLTLFRDLAATSRYSWGAGCLSYLYRELGTASRSDVHQIGGNLTLLQAWIYEHFPTLNPIQNLSYINANPRAQRWKVRKYSDSVPVLRERLDDLQVHEVCWEPYKADRDSHPLFEIAFFSGCIKCGSITEPYHAERVLWQFGFIQSIPPEPLAPSKAIRGKTAKNYRVAYDQLDQIWNRRHMYVLLQESRGTPCTIPGECVPDYLSWYVQVSHPIIQNPARRCTSRSVRQSSNEMHIQRAVDVIKRAISIGSPNDVDVWRKAVFDVLRILTSEADASSSTGDENQAHEEKPKLT